MYSLRYKPWYSQLSCVSGHAPGQLYTYPARCWRKKRRLNILEDPRLVPIEFKIGKEEEEGMGWPFLWTLNISYSNKMNKTVHKCTFVSHLLTFYNRQVILQQTMWTLLLHQFRQFAATPPSLYMTEAEVLFCIVSTTADVSANVISVLFSDCNCLVLQTTRPL